MSPHSATQRPLTRGRLRWLATAALLAFLTTASAAAPDRAAAQHLPTVASAISIHTTTAPLMPQHPSASTTLVVNEIDYDQPGADTAEFIEIKNIDSSSINLDSYSLVLVNGTGGGASTYKTVDLPNTNLGAGDYYVVCKNPSNVPNCDLEVSQERGLVQNGAPDAVAIEHDGSVIDTVSYEGDTGSPYTEGSGAGLADTDDNDYEGISRYPDGTDSDQNNSDLSVRCVTPGDANSSDSSNCPNPAGEGTAAPTGSATATATPTGNATATPMSSATPTPDPTATTAPSSTSASTPAPTQTRAPSPTPTPSATATVTGVPSTSSTPPATATARPTATATALPPRTPSATPSRTPTATAESLAVELTKFTADRVGTTVLIEWKTDSEHKHAGFNVWRDCGTRGLVRVNPDLVRARGSSMSGADYTLRDTRAPIGETLYWLDDVDVLGNVTRHGPVKAPRAHVRFRAEPRLELISR